MEARRSLTRKSDHTQTVRTVGRDLEFRHHVVQTDCRADVETERAVAVVAEYKNAVFNRIGEVMRRQTQLAQRAEHAAAFHTAQFARADLLAAGHDGVVERDRHNVAGLEILCAGDDLERFAAHVDLTHPQVVGIRVTFEREHLTDDYVAQSFTLGFVALDLGAGQRHDVGKFFIGCRNRHIGLQPFF